MSKQIIDISVIHTTYNRIQHLPIVLKRFELNQLLHGDKINFELIILNGGSNDGTEEYINQWLPTTNLKAKHVMVNFGTWINPSLPRNIAFRHATGRIVCNTDADHWVGENFIIGAYEAFKNGRDDCISLGMVEETYKSQRYNWAHINKWLIEFGEDEQPSILQLYKRWKMPQHALQTAGMCAFPAWALHEVGGYCEDFKGPHWGREENLMLDMLSQILNITQEHYRKFAAIHLSHSVRPFGMYRHPQHNHPIYLAKKANILKTIKENKGHDWGRIPEGVQSYVKKNY